MICKPLMTLATAARGCGLLTVVEDFGAVAERRATSKGVLQTERGWEFRFAPPVATREKWLKATSSQASSASC